MYKNLEAELARSGMTKGDLAKALQIRPTTLSNKLSGKSIITLAEALKIKCILGVNMSIEELFAVA